MDRYYLFEKLGSTLQLALADDDITEIMLNDDGQLWLVHREKGTFSQGVMSHSSALAFVHALAHFHDQFLNSSKPFLDCTLPFNDERVNATIPPITNNVTFNIRKRAKHIYTFDDYERDQIITHSQRSTLRAAIAARKNILVSGGPGTGKTTFTNALLSEMADAMPLGHRALILEQVPELQCALVNKKYLYTTEHTNMQTLLWIAMRNSPDCIIVGEVRDCAALDLLKAWNTGCPGGVATIHANSVHAAMQRIIDLSLEVSNHAPYSLAGEAVDVIVQLEKDSTLKSGRRVTGVVGVEEYHSKTNEFVFVNLEDASV